MTASRIVVKAKVHLLAEDEGGRHAPISSGYRPSFYFGTTVRGVREMTDATIELDHTQWLSPGDTGDARLHPYFGEQWTSLRPGDVVEFFEGGRKVGTASVVEIEVIYRK